VKYVRAINEGAAGIVPQVRGRRGWPWGLALALLATMATGAAYAEVPQPAGWTLQFSDDFNGAAGQVPSAERWRFDTGHGYPGGPANWGTHEVQRYTADPANVSLDGRGHLRITPRRDAAGEWTSARIETQRDDFRPPEGGVLRMEARLRMPDVSGDAALGYWPAFWALGESFRRTGNWPQAGEFDIMENVNGLNLVWGTLHCGVQPGGPCGEPNGIGQHSPCAPTTCQRGFHTYTFEWDRSVAPEALRWYLDGQLYGVITRDRLPPVTWQEITGQRGYFLLLDVAMGGDFAYAISGGRDPPVPATEPGHPMVVDYVAVWTRIGPP
jgi:beta-glucanase (GH16 family)